MAEQARAPILIDFDKNLTATDPTISIQRMNDGWDFDRLNAMIASKIEENFSLDYKAAGAIDDKKKNEITKDVSAMANSSGGTIIYGIAEYKDEARCHLPEKIDPVIRIDFSKEWLGTRKPITSIILAELPNKSSVKGATQQLPSVTIC